VTKEPLVMTESKVLKVLKVLKDCQTLGMKARRVGLVQQEIKVVKVNLDIMARLAFLDQKVK
jgi:hypothetical protein